MADSILKSAAIERSFDNLTIVIIAFKSVNDYYEEKRKLFLKKVQTIKIEGEQQSTTNHMISRHKNMAQRAQPQEDSKLNGNLAGLYQGFNSTKAKKAKESMSSEQDRSNNLRSSSQDKGG